MEDPLESARYLLARARQHANEFKTQIDTVFDGNPYAKVTEEDPKTGETVLKIKLTKPLPYMINGIVIDAVINFRCALDHCGFAFCGITDDRTTHTNFPFCDHPNELVGRNTRGTSREIPPDIFAVMAEFKPYKGGDDLLWCINKIANSNKHKVIRPIGVYSGGSSFDLRNVEVIRGPMSLSVPKWDKDKNEMEIMRVGPFGHAKLSADVALDTIVAFGKVPVVEGQEVSRVLDAFGGKVEGIINAIGIEAKRLGLY